MIDNICIELIKSVINSQKDFIVVFKDEEPVLTNISFNKFFGVSSFERYKSSFGPFLDNFVPHPFYFNKEKIEGEESWFEAILKLDEIDKIVSMLSPKHEPHAFSVKIDSSVENFKVVTFTDITQTLIKRIMTENKTNIDKKSGAYTKQYFLHILKSYEDTALFNEKIIGLMHIEIYNEESLEVEKVKEFIKNFKSTIRQDDMLVSWANSKFLLLFLVDDEEKAAMVVNKVKSVINQNSITGSTYEFSSIWQKDKESISKLIQKLEI